MKRTTEPDEADVILGRRLKSLRVEVLILTRRFALELGQHGIRVNAVAPGFVHTELTQRGRGAADWPAIGFDQLRPQ